MAQSVIINIISCNNYEQTIFQHYTNYNTDCVFTHLGSFYYAQNLLPKVFIYYINGHLFCAPLYFLVPSILQHGRPMHTTNDQSNHCQLTLMMGETHC